jgi:hypothetical protein
LLIATVLALRQQACEQIRALRALHRMDKHGVEKPISLGVDDLCRWR